MHGIFSATRSVHFLFRPKSKISDRKFRSGPWASPLVPVKKKERRTRWVPDLRLLNATTVKDAYPLTNIQENFFSSIDACGAYHCIQIED